MTANCGPKRQLALVVLDAPRRYEVAGHGERERKRETGLRSAGIDVVTGRRAQCERWKVGILTVCSSSKRAAALAEN